MIILKLIYTMRCKKKKRKEKTHFVCLTDKWNGEVEVCKTH